MSHDHDPQQPPRPAYPPQGSPPAQGSRGPQESHAPHPQQPPGRIPHPHQQPPQLAYPPQAPHPPQQPGHTESPSGPPSGNGQHGLSESDQNGEEEQNQDLELAEIEWPKQLRKAIGTSVSAAIVATILLWLLQTGLLTDQIGRAVEPDSSGWMGVVMLLLFAWMLPLLEFDLLIHKPVTRWLPTTGYIYLISFIHAAMLTLSTMLWPFVIGAAGIGQRFEDWPITPMRLALTFICCWAVALSSVGSALSMPRLLLSRLWMFFLVGFPWVFLTLGGCIILAVVVGKTSPMNYGSVLAVVTVVLLAVLIFVPAVLAFNQPRLLANLERDKQRRAQQSEPRRG